MPKRVYTQAIVSVRFSSPNLDPLVVTKALRLPPDHQHRDGEPCFIRTRSGKIEERGMCHGGMWSMDSTKWVKSSRLETHLDWLLLELEPRADAIQELIASGIEVDFFCSTFGSSKEPPSLPRSIRERADKLVIKIEIDHHSSEDDNETGEES